MWDDCRKSCNFNTSHVSVQVAFGFSTSIYKLNFNTSHVSVQVKRNKKVFELYKRFQYITCIGSSLNIQLL
jgi:hypothetical protein